MMISTFNLIIIFQQVMADKGGKKNDFGTFVLDFLMGGVSAAVSKTFASPIEVIKLRLQNV